jgi:putative DNA primase/helicase
MVVARRFNINPQLAGCTLEPRLSDALCRLSTGGGIATRELWSNADEIIFDAQRPIMLNGIEDVATRPDLIDRSIFLYLPQIKESDRQDEALFWRAFEEARPCILGALLNAAAVALRSAGRVRFQQLPRMADFAVWAAAGEAGLRLKPGAFLEAYEKNRKDGTWHLRPRLWSLHC